MFKFIHCADLHLDSPLRGLAEKPDAPVEEIRQASRRALGNLVNLALEENVQFVLIAGDVYDGDWQDYSTGLFFNAQMNRLKGKKTFRSILFAGITMQRVSSPTVSFYRIMCSSFPWIGRRRD